MELLLEGRREISVNDKLVSAEELVVHLSTMDSLVIQYTSQKKMLNSLQHVKIVLV